ncbi:hypothetical protein [Curvivirga aplysinae]|uniref:hypothetical protein n=1 Tax=Curvivirga aplysinae TaxID=2529852 RepID=UPI0012BBEBA1|nr:hypothetical protein [Curvivirga aplysinae]MTI08210.1 hypothetical protein [Curvivirga aplysinae]
MTLKSISKVIFGILALSLLAACAPKNQEFSGRNTVPVMILAEDESGNSLPRSSLVHKQIIAKVQRQLLRQGFTVKDGDFVLSDAGITQFDRMTKSEIIEAAKLANGSASASRRARALVLVRVFSRSQNASFSNIVHTHLEGEIYDLKNNSYMTGFDTPVKKFGAPTDCDMICAITVTSRETAPLADDLGSVLSRKLAALVDGRQIANDQPRNSTSSSHLAKKDTYVFNLIGFNTEEALEIMRVMSKEFPGYQSHDLIARNNQQWTYEYHSKANFGKLEKWVSILLIDMGYDPDREVDIKFANNNFTLNLKEAQIPSPSGSGTKPTGSARFQ